MTGRELTAVIWGRIPRTWLGDLVDSKVRADVVQTIYENQGFAIFIHALIALTYCFSNSSVKSYFLYFLLVIFVATAIERYRIQKIINGKNLIEDDVNKYFLLGIFYPIIYSLVLSIVIYKSLNEVGGGFNNPVVFGGLLYYFGAIIKNISMRIVTIIYSAIVLLPISFYFFRSDKFENLIIAIFVATLAATMILFSKTMGNVFTSKIKQNFELEYLTRQLIEARDKANSANQSKTYFLAAASHDLRQPVHAIGLYLTTLAQKPLAIEVGHAVTGIRQSWSALDGLLSQILELSHADDNAQHKEIASIPIAPVLSAVVFQYAANSDAKNQRVVILSKPGVRVLADLPMLRRVLSNLLDNAIKYAPLNSTIAVAVRSRGTKWAIQVRDAGFGIAPADQEKVFEMFVQAGNRERARNAGYGIGLTIASRFVAAMGGVLEVRSDLNRGTCMTVVLAKAAPLGLVQSATSVHPTEAVAQSVGIMAEEQLRLDPDVRSRILRSGKELLLVEDDPLVTDAFSQVFSSLGLSYRCVVQSEQALIHAGDTLAAICDMRLPGEVSGLALAERFKALGIPALLVTGENMQSLNAELERAKVECLQKPVQPQKILDWLATVV